MRGKKAIQKGKIKMLNMDQNKLVEVINQFVITKYTENISTVKSRVIKLFSAMPYTGAPNISDMQRISIIEDLEKFVALNFTISNN